MKMQSKSQHDSPKKHSGEAFAPTHLIENEGKQFGLFEIAIEMKKSGLPSLFIINAVRAALDFEGISDLILLWGNETDKQGKEEIIADIQDMLDACNQSTKLEDVYIKFNDLDAIAKNIRAFKDSLLQIVNERGGISHLAELTGIPQPSLSRFFNSSAMPHRSTLLKIAKALSLDEIKIELLWTK